MLLRTVSLLAILSTATTTTARAEKVDVAELQELCDGADGADDADEDAALAEPDPAVEFLRQLYLGLLRQKGFLVAQLCADAVRGSSYPVCTFTDGFPNNPPCWLPFFHATLVMRNP